MDKKGIGFLLFIELILSLLFGLVITIGFDLPFWIGFIVTIVVFAYQIYAEWKRLKCPECGYLLHDIVNTCTEEKTGISILEKVECTCKCKRCRHEWRRQGSSPSQSGW